MSKGMFIIYVIQKAGNMQRSLQEAIQTINMPNFSSRIAFATCVFPPFYGHVEFFADSSENKVKKRSLHYWHSALSLIVFKYAAKSVCELNYQSNIVHE